MKKTAKLVLISSFILLFSACSQEEENSISNPITDPAGHTADMIGLERDMEKNIQDSVNKENNSNNRVLLDNSIIEDFNYQHTPQNKNMILDGKNMLSSKFFSRHPSNDYYDNHLNKLKSEGDLSVNMSKEEDSSKDL